MGQLLTVCRVSLVGIGVHDPGRIVGDGGHEQKWFPDGVGAVGGVGFPSRCNMGNVFPGVSRVEMCETHPKPEAHEGTSWYLPFVSRGIDIYIRGGFIRGLSHAREQDCACRVVAHVDCKLWSAPY